MLGINDLAPEFTLKNTSKEDVSLSDFTDKTVVLAFYPGAFTGVCDAEMCALQDNLKSFNDLNAIVLGISVDSPWANGGFSKQYSLEFDLLSDLDKKVIEFRYILTNFKLFKAPLKETKNNFIRENQNSVFFLNHKNWI